MARGLIIGAPASGSGKTTLTLGLLRALRNAGVAAASFKVGPDYIDPAFHARASGRPCRNIDLWGMRPETRARVLADTAADADIVVGEGVMGLFDAAVEGDGSTGDAARDLGLPVVLVVDAGAQAESAAAVVHGFASFREDVSVAGVVFTKVGGPGHVELLTKACAALPVTMLGALPFDASLSVPERHLGLVQATEHDDFEAFAERAAAAVADHVDIDALGSLAAPIDPARPASPPPFAPLGQRIAVASDAAFAFAYPHLLDGWRRAGAEIVSFSPLADEAPPGDADAVFLPGGYPELHAGRLAANRRFLDGLRKAAADSTAIYGECGGYMVLGQALTDADGTRHAMAGLLPVETSFAERALHFGYRSVRTTGPTALGPGGSDFRGHEFHYASIVSEGGGDPLFEADDMRGKQAPAGLRVGGTCGSFIHVIDRYP